VVKVLADVDLNLIKNSKNKLIGLKQTLRAIQQDVVKTVYYANDIEDHVLKKISEACLQKQIPLTAVGCGREELGRACQIEVGAAVVAILK